MFTLALPVIFVFTFARVQGLCGDSVSWSHSFNIDDIFGVWYGTGHAQHSPDMTNIPVEIGCVILYISDATHSRPPSFDWTIERRNFTDQNWRSYKSNPWSDIPMSGSWLDIPIKNKIKRETQEYRERRLQVMWDEDGQTMEQYYVYSTDTPGIWILDQRRPREMLLQERGLDIWYPDDPPRHPEVIRILKATPELLILNHCSETGSGGMFTLILRRSPSVVTRREWYDLQNQFYSLELPKAIRFQTICEGCTRVNSIFNLIFCILILQII